MSANTGTIVNVNDDNDKPLARSVISHLSPEAASRTPSSLKLTAVRVQENPSAISLAVARPHLEYYAWRGASFTTQNPSVANPSTSALSPATHSTLNVNDPFAVLSDIAIACNYGFSGGDHALVAHIKALVQRIHAPPIADWNCAMSCGSTSALEIALRMFVARGEVLLVEEYTYSGLVELTKPFDIVMQSIRMDKEGLRPDHLDMVLNEWNDELRGYSKPRVLYTIPTGHNPTGCTQSVERRKEIMRVAEIHDLYIIEDDPYMFVQVGLAGDASIGAKKRDMFLANLPPSYLSLNRTGRVMRLDTFSKTLAPGLRAGYITASNEVVDMFIMHSEFSTISPSGISQLMITRLFQDWGQDGLIDWFVHISTQYRCRMEIMLEACDKYLPKKICSWDAAKFGMFVWIKVDIQAYIESQLFNGKTFEREEDIEGRIYERGAAEGVLVTKGSWFKASKEFQDAIFLRLTFAAADFNVLEEGIKRLGAALK